MEILHVSAECYPMAKAGGLGDVVGALPKYQNKAGHIAKVVMPMYRTKFLYQNNWVVDFKGKAVMDGKLFEYTIIKEATNKLGYDLYLVDIPGLLDREKVYGYDDDTERFVAFQIAVLSWVNSWEHLLHIIHCHDHHTGLIPFMVKYAYPFARLAQVPTIFTIHNAQYQGWMGWDKQQYIPAWDSWKAGNLEWEKTINPLASAIKCAWKVTTVSNSYLEELRYEANGLEKLFEYEKGKTSGILNGIDVEVWNPKTDEFLIKKYTSRTIKKGKQANKEFLCEKFNLAPELPLFIFIGRLVGEKAADILPEAFSKALQVYNGAINILVLGSGDISIEHQLNQLKSSFEGNYNVVIGYDETLSHIMYAGADYLLMPSRVEPCGLNQMYAMKYGTVPMVRNTGGLKDTVSDIGNFEGWGITYNQASVDDVVHAIYRAIALYDDKIHFNWVRNKIMAIDNSWENAINQYINLYQSVQL